MKKILFSLMFISQIAFAGTAVFINPSQSNLDVYGNLSVSGTTTLSGQMSMDVGTGTGQLTLDGSLGGCLMIRDTDDAGWTECDVLDGVMSCSSDANGICD